MVQLARLSHSHSVEINSSLCSNIDSLTPGDIPNCDPDPSLRLGYSLYQMVGSGLAGAAVAGVLTGLLMSRTFQQAWRWLRNRFWGRSNPNDNVTTDSSSSDYGTFASARGSTAASRRGTMTASIYARLRAPAGRYVPWDKLLKCESNLTNRFSQVLD